MREYREYKEIFDKMPIAMLCVKYSIEENENLKMEIEYANNRMLLLLNSSYEEVVKKDFFDILSEYKEDKEFINIIKNYDGTISTYSKYINSLMNFIHITIQKTGENRFLIYFENCIAKDFFKGIHEANGIFYVKDINNKYVHASDRFKHLVGFGDNLSELNDIKIHGEDAGQKYLKCCEEFMASNEYYRKEICKLKDKIYSLHKHAIYDNSSNVIGVLGVFEDIVEKKEKIEDGNTLSYIINNISDYIVLKDANRVHLDCNNTFLQDLGISREEFVGKKIEEIPELNKILKHTIEKDLETIKLGTKQIYNETVLYDGVEFDFEIIKEPFRDSYGNLVGIIDIARNVSHRREVEKLRLDFFANLSHELRTPLNLIFSSLQTIDVLEKDLLENNSRLKKYIGIISQNSKRLLKLVNNLIDSTKFDSGYYKYEPKNDDIVSFIENISMSVAEFAKQNGICLTFDTDVEEKIMAFDLEKLERTMLNLLSNSIKYNKSNGEIHVLLQDAGDNFNITVKDSGIGIPEERLDIIFERFNQVENRFTKRSEGSGIGLSLVKDLVKIQGGSIEVKSKVNVGSEFTIKLPVKVLEENNVLKEQTYNNLANSSEVRMNIEFSDIYL